MSMKRLLQKVVGTHRLTFEELTTVLAEAEATMNSRPLLPSTPPRMTEFQLSHLAIFLLVGH